MNATKSFNSPSIKALAIGILAGVLVRMGIFVNNFYYPDIGMPYILALPGGAIVIVAILAYLIGQ